MCKGEKHTLVSISAQAEADAIGCNLLSVLKGARR